MKILIANTEEELKSKDFKSFDRAQVKGKPYLRIDGVFTPQRSKRVKGGSGGDPDKLVEDKVESNFEQDWETIEAGFLPDSKETPLLLGRQKAFNPVNRAFEESFIHDPSKLGYEIKMS